MERHSQFASLPWWKLTPDPSILAGGAGSGKALNAAMRTTDSDSVIAYLSGPTRVSIHMDRITAGTRVTARWFNPICGDETLIGSYPNSGARSFSTPDGWEDAVLLLTV